MHWPKVNRNTAALTLIVISSAALAEHQTEPPGWTEIGSTMIASATSVGEHESAGVAAFDVAVGMPIQGGQLSLLIEAETRPGIMSGSPGHPTIDHEAGVTLGANQNQVQVSELHYDFSTHMGDWAIGFIDSKAYIDSSAIANDEKTQFSNPAFVNNPTISLPDNSLGFSWQLPATAERAGYSFLLAETKGPGRFIAFETWWAFTTVTARLGAWDNNSSHSERLSRDTANHDYGFYTAIDGSLALFNWNVRAGLSNPEGNFTQSFIGVAAEIPVAGNMIGVAVGHGTRGGLLSVAGSGQASHIEVYYRYAVSDGFVITPCIQFSRNGDFGNEIATLTGGVRFRLNM